MVEGVKDKNKTNEATTPTERLAYTLEQAADAIQVSEVSIRRLISRGLLSPAPGLRHIRISRTAIQNYLEGRAK
jgi:excisionase family DNA binding protein